MYIKQNILKLNMWWRKLNSLKHINIKKVFLKVKKHVNNISLQIK